MQNKWQNSTKKWGEGEQNGVKLLWGCYIYMTLYHSNFWVGYGELVITEDATSNPWKTKNKIVEEGWKGRGYMYTYGWFSWGLTENDKIL